VAVVQKKFKSKLERKEKELMFQANEKDFKLKEADSHLQAVQNIAQARLNVTLGMHIENIRLKQAAKVALDQKDIAWHQALAAQRLKTSTLLAEKQQKMNQQQKELEGVQELAIDVAEEHNQLSKICAKTTKEAKKKAAAAEEIASKRLLKYKDATAEINALRDDLEATKDELSFFLDEAFEEILHLREQLQRKQEEADEFEVLAHLAGLELEALSYHTVTKVGNPKTWDPIVTQLVIEMLVHGTPPSSISANILSVCKLLFPGVPIIKELPSVRYVCNCRTVSLHLAKTLAAFEIASQGVFSQLFTDGTTRRQTEFHFRTLSLSYLHLLATDELL
jgi:hypothetical protein